MASAGIMPVPQAAGVLRRAKQDALRVVARAFAGNAGRPEPHGGIEDLALPPVGIAAGEVHRPFGAAGPGLAELIAGHEQPLAIGRAGGVELGLSGIGPIGGKLVSAAPPVQLRQQAEIFLPCRPAVRGLLRGPAFRGTA